MNQNDTASMPEKSKRREISPVLGYRNSLYLGVLLCFLLMSPMILIAGQAADDSIAGFKRISRGEELRPKFNVAGGQTSEQIYSGFVEILVSGSGLNNLQNPDLRSDAFYNFSAKTNESIGLFDNTLRLGTETQLLELPRGFKWCPNSSLHGEAGSVHVANLAVGYEGRSFPVDGAFSLDATGGLAPEFSREHTYHFVINLGCYGGRLTLGFGDGGVWDNSDDVFQITLWQTIQAARDH